MKANTLVVAMGLAALSALSIPTFAQADNSNDVQKMDARATKLEKQLDRLQHEIDTLKREQSRVKSEVAKERATNGVKNVYTPAKNGVKGIAEKVYYPHTVFKYGGVAVITSPYIGVRSEFDGADLIVNISSINEDLRLLEQMQILGNALRTQNAPPLTHPLIELSGKIEAFTFVQDKYVGSTTGDVDLGTAEIDALAYMSSWALGFMAITYDGSSSDIYAPRTSNSRFFLNKGFLTIGNLERAPWYTTWGQYYVPFGRYSSNMLSAPLPLVLSRTKSRAILLGYRQPGENIFFASIYGFRGDTKVHSSWQGGFNIGYDFLTHNVGGEVGASIIANIADANGMQFTGGSEFSGFGLNSQTECLSKRIPAFDVHTNLSYGPWSFIGEYVTALRTFSPNDLQFNGEGAKPYALNVEASYQFYGFNKKMSISLGYGHSGEAYALNLAKHRIIAAFNTALIRNTIQTLEIRHDINYSSGTTGAGRVGAGDDNVAEVSTAPAGNSSTIATVQVGLYF